MRINARNAFAVAGCNLLWRGYGASLVARRSSRRSARPTLPLARDASYRLTASVAGTEAPRLRSVHEERTHTNHLQELYQCNVKQCPRSSWGSRYCGQEVHSRKPVAALVEAQAEALVVPAQVRRVLAQRVQARPVLAPPIQGELSA
jgi:hypothetical protein